ncbi:MAG: haloalkane dehalogenase [Bacteroidota bacterium]
MQKLWLSLGFFLIVCTVHAQSPPISFLHSNTKEMTFSALDQPNISAAFPFQSHYATVLGNRIHYIDESTTAGEHTFVLLHGNPTSSYIWRNIIPYLTPHGRVIAPDLIGMGKSDKPDIDYTLQDHIAHMDGLLAQLELDKIIFVIQDWGSGIGFHYAHRFPDRVAGIAFFEAITRTIEWEEATFLERLLFRRFRHPKKGYKMIVKNNFFIKRFLPLMTRRKLTKEEKAAYAAPYPTEADRKAVWVWPSQIAISGQPKASYDIVNAYEKWLPTSTLPKLMFHADPGMIIKPQEAEKIKAIWKNVSTIDLGKGKHYLQETYPHQIGEGISTWYTNTFER